MSAEPNVLAGDATADGAARWLAAPESRASGFRVALICATSMHAALFVGVGRTSSGGPAGEAAGSTDPIAVSLVTDGELQDMAAGPKSDDTTPDAADKTSDPPAPAALQPPAQATPTLAAPTQPGLDHPTPDLLALPGAAGERGAPRSTAEPRRQKSAGLDLSIPLGVLQRQGSAAGRSTSANRPPDITRSLENDEFGRGVNAAMRRTMPIPDGTIARVTIRIILSETGNVVESLLVGAGKDPVLEQRVLFAARQASYPIPPTGSTLADRTFRVTYIYN